MQIQGHTLAEQDDLSAEFQDLVVGAIHRVTNELALRVIQDGFDQTPGLTAAGSLDDVVVLWDDEVPELVGYLDGVYDAGALEAAHELVTTLPIPDGEGIPGIPDQFSLDYLAQATNRLSGVGDELWENIRAELVEGHANGESVAQLAARVQAAGGMTEARAKTIARTELVGASNAGTHAQVQMIVPEAKKEWVATNDGRTRFTHAHADGQRVLVTEAFSVGGSSLRWPGDPGGAAGEVINCRCTLIFDVDDDTPPAVTCGCADAVLAVTAAFVAVPSGGCTCKVTYPTPSGAGTFNLTPSQHKQIFDTFMGSQPISPAYGGAKIYKKLQEARAALKAKGYDKFADLTDHELLAVIDEQYTGGSYTFTQKFDEWLASPAGKKAAPNVNIPKTNPVNTPSAPSAPSTPSPLVAKPSHNLPPIKAKPDPDDLTYTGKTLGSHGAQVWEDNNGGKWLFKPQSKFMTDVDVSMAKLQSKSLSTRTATYKMKLNGKNGSIQYMFDGSKDAWPSGHMNPSALTPDEIITLQREHVFDWLIGNHDAHEGQFVRLPDGTIVGVDKGQAFKFFGTDKLDWNYKAPGNVGTPVYNTLWKAYVDGTIDMPNPTTGEVGEYIQTFMNMPDDEYRALLKAYAQGVPKLPGNFKTIDEFLDAAVARKNNLQKDFNDLWLRAETARAKKLSKTTPVKVAPTPAKVTPPTPSVSSPATNTPFTENDLGLELAVHDIFAAADNASVGDIVAEGFTQVKVPMRVVVKNKDAWGSTLETQYWMNGKWNSNTKSLLTENHLKNEHPGVKWHKPHTTSAPSVPSTPTVVTVKAPVTPSSVSLVDKHGLLSLMKENQPITPGWGGAKVYKQLEQIKLKIAGLPEYSGLTDRQLLQLMDEVAPHATSKTYESVVTDWLNTPAGKKYAGGGPDILDAPKPGAVVPTPVSPVVTVGKTSYEGFDGLSDLQLFDVVNEGDTVDFASITAIAGDAPNDSVIAVSMKQSGGIVRLVKKNDEIYYQVYNDIEKKWHTVSAVIDENMMTSYQNAGKLLPWKVPKGSKIPAKSAPHVPTKTTPVKKTLPKKVQKKAAAQQAQQSASLVSHFEPDALLNDTSTIDSLSSSLQTKIFTSFKDKAAGSYLNSSPEEIFSHLASTLQELQQTAQYKNLTPMQLLRVIDAQSAKKFGVTNDKLFEKKITEWLKTPAGKQHANDIFTGKKAILPKVKKGAKKVPTYTPPSYTSPSYTPPVSTYKAPVKVATHTKPDTPDMSAKVKAAQPASTRPYDSIQHKEVMDMFHEMQSQQGTWTAAEKSSLRYYSTNSGYDAMNNCLRGYTTCSPATLKHIKNAQAGMRRSTKNAILRRGTNADEFPGFSRNATLDELKTLEGREIKADSFLSTSYGDSPAFGGNVMIEFEIPAGTPLAYIGRGSDPTSATTAVSRYPGENEILLGAGLRYKVISVKQINSYRRIVRVRVIVP